MSSTDFWQENQVGGPYSSLQESVLALQYREAEYPDLHKLMPVNFPGQTILDFGCGPGHDTIAFLERKAKHVYFADVSWQALQTTNDRLAMHNLRDRATALFSDDQLPTVDHIHCAGVLHHMADPVDALERLRHCGPELRVMVYDGDLSTPSDSLVPITEWWTRTQFLRMAKAVGWKGVWVGSYPCSAEWRPNCYAACYALH